MTNENEVIKLADELVAMIDNAINDNDVHPDDVLRAAQLNNAELDGIDTLENDDLIERCDHCDEPAFAICVDCDATMCKRHTVISIDNGEPIEQCFRCAGIVPYITRAH
jgi:hypothetical protein